ncbi:hypothetical protein GJ496_000708 [Pomphorhynchus laevis]|nr:hypothetical protein GJ496_000708 [Pomphorhynchus laevis]
MQRSLLTTPTDPSPTLLYLRSPSRYKEFLRNNEPHCFHGNHTTISTLKTVLPHLVSIKPLYQQPSILIGTTDKMPKNVNALARFTPEL